MSLLDDIEYVIDRSLEVDKKIAEIHCLIWEQIESQVHAEIDRLSEQLVFGQVQYPNVLEFVCQLP